MELKTKVVINDDWGGFCLSKAALERYCELKGLTFEEKEGAWGTWGYIVGDDENWCESDIKRHDPALVQVVEELGEKANGPCGSLVVEEVDGDRYFIVDYDGVEMVYTPINAPWIEAKHG